MSRLTKLFFPHKDKKKEEISEYERANIMEEMLKKNLELADKNKTLSLLQEIDEIILSKVTDPHELAKKVTELLVSEANFRIAGIYVFDEEKEHLLRLELSFNEKIVFLNKQEVKKLIDDVAAHPTPNNVLYAAMEQKDMKATTNIYEFVSDAMISNKGAEDIQKEADLKTMYVYPLVVRDEAIGVMIISLGDSLDNLKENDRDLMSRLSRVMAIAIDNSHLFTQVQKFNRTMKL
jgi:GAF domain-containing protein